MTFIKLFHTFFFLSLLSLTWPLLETTWYSQWLIGGLWLAYGAALVGLLGDQVWCARLLILPPLAIVVWTAPWILYNFFAFVTGDPLYLDSPATIIVVAIPAIVVTGPSVAVLVAYWMQSGLIFSRKANASKASATDL